MSNKYNIESTNIQTAPGVKLSEDQQTIVGSVLDLFAGRPSLEKLSLWTDDAVFEDPITQARGRKQYEPQWYGLQAAFSEIERLHHSVTSSGNPIEMDLKTRYKVKGVGMEQVIDSKILINLDSQGKITHVQDKWDGKLPESSIQNAFRRLNAVTVPNMVGVPKNKEEDAAKGNAIRASPIVLSCQLSSMMMLSPMLPTMFWAFTALPSLETQLPAVMSRKILPRN